MIIMGTIARNMYTLKGAGRGKRIGRRRRRDLGDAVGYAVQAHHCDQLFDHRRAQVQERPTGRHLDYDINAGSNARPVPPAYFGHMRVERASVTRWTMRIYRRSSGGARQAAEGPEGRGPCKARRTARDVLKQRYELRTGVKLQAAQRSVLHWSEALLADYRTKADQHGRTGAGRVRFGGEEWEKRSPARRSSAGTRS
jgi:hypothetical protein